MWTLLVACAPGPGADLVVTEIGALSVPATGVAVNAEGETFLASANGLFTADGQTVADALALTGAEEAEITDVFALGDGTFAITVPGLGLRYDPVSGERAEYFCYLPSTMPVEATQITSATAYDPEADLIYAQPLSFIGTDQVGSAIGVWEGSNGGEPVVWEELERQRFEASGMAVDGEELLLASGAVLWRTQGALAELERYVDLGRATGGEAITGLTLTAGDTLTVSTEDGRALRLTGWRPR